MINLFVDSNIYLNLFHFGEEDLARLEDLEKLILQTQQIKLWLPVQVVSEFNRNRESKIKEALKQFEESGTSIKVPNLCAGYEEIPELKRLSRLMNESKKRLVDKLNTDIKARQLAADKIIDRLFDSQKREISSTLLKKAKVRFDLGNPPGKNNSYGDAVNWCFLMEEVPKGEDLFFISADKDYVSGLDGNSFSLFLDAEWNRNKNSQIYFYKNLQSFFKDKFPSLELVGEYLKDQEIKRFANSKSFDQTRQHIRGLLRVSDFSPQQLEEILKAATINDQIYNANKYSPDIVGAKLAQIISGHEFSLPRELYEEFCKRFEIRNEYDDTPF